VQSLELVPQAIVEQSTLALLQEHLLQPSVAGNEVPQLDTTRPTTTDATRQLARSQVKGRCRQLGPRYPNSAMANERNAKLSALPRSDNCLGPAMDRLRFRHYPHSNARYR
jgi:hypothetical protein